MTATTLLDNQRGNNAPRRFELLVMASDAMTTHALPDTGTLTIGRADTAEVPLSDPLASRFHARLHVSGGGFFEIEDLGSINKTRIRDVELRPSERVAIASGEAVTIGSTIIMVHEPREHGRRRRVWAHSHFEARLEEEVARSQRSRAPFATVRVHVEPDPGPAALIDMVGPALRVPDLFAVYGPGEFELLLPETGTELATAIAQDLVRRLAAVGIVTRVGMACYPRDGRSSDELISVAGARERGSKTAARIGEAVVLEDPMMRRLFQLAERAAAGTINVLVVGETGVGKEILAQTIHRRSPRSKAPLVSFNCAAFSDALIESELFGHERGAFSGAVSAKTGLLETADGGTVFLDEIGDMPLAIQAKLLRAIETKQIMRVGGLKPRSLDVRFISATNRNLEREAAAGTFRQDLYFRINGIKLVVPPLRDRRVEILPLALNFLNEASVAGGRSVPPVIGEDAAELLMAYSWPGNVRELKNIMERAALLCMGAEINTDHLPVETMEPNASFARPEPGTMPLSAPTGPLESMTERDRILHALNACVWNQSRAAKMLDMSRTRFVQKLAEFNIPRPRK